MRGMRAITREEVKRVLKDTFSLREKALLTIGFSTGFRISELLSIRIKDVLVFVGPGQRMVSTGSLTVKASNTKTGQGRTMKLNSLARNASLAFAKELLENGSTKDAPLFQSRKRDAYGEPKAISRQRAWEILKQLFNAVEILGNVGTHSLRKTFAMNIYNFTKSIEMVRSALGHASLDTTYRYLDLDYQIIAEAIEKFDQEWI